MVAACRRSLPVIFVLWAWSIVTGLGNTTRAAEPLNAAAVPTVILRQTQSAGWQVTETLNFRFFHHGQFPLVERLAKLCEESRHTIRSRWITTPASEAWSIKCDVYLYASPADFLQKTRFPPDSWGFADLEIGQGKVWMRRLDLRSDQEARLMNVAVHELAHVVLADRFATRQIPRWADEGIALNSEPASRQRDLRGWLATQIRQGRGYTLPQLVSLRQYPPDKFLGDLFYAQSGSLVEFLLTRQGDSAESVLRFVESSQPGAAQPVTAAALAQLESEWKAWLLQHHEVQLAAD